MAKEQVDISLKTTADSKGVDQLSLSFGQLEEEIKAAEAALKKVDVESKQFKSLNSELAKTKKHLTNLKAGKFDDASLKSFKSSIQSVRSLTGKLRKDLDKPIKARGLDSLTAKFGKLSGSIGGTIAKITGVGVVLRQSFNNVSQLENLTASFETLLGSLEQAEEKLESIRQVASSTPLSIGGLTVAVRQLQTLTDGALATEEGIKLVGDAAAVAQQPMQSLDASVQNVALHIGRLYTALNSGEGQLGESILRLQELGLVSPAIARQLRELHEEGDRGAEAWAVLEGQLKNFEGQMEKMSRTLGGSVSNLTDAWNTLLTTVSKPLWDAAKPAIRGITGALNLLNAAATRTAGLFKGDIPSGIEETGEKAKAAKMHVADLNKAVKEGAEQSKASIQALTDQYDDLIAKVDKALDREKSLNQIRLNIALGDIEATPDKEMSPAMKERRKGAIRESFGVADQALTEQSIENALEMNRRESEEFANNVHEASKELERLKGSLVALDESVNKGFIQDGQYSPEHRKVLKGLDERILEARRMQREYPQLGPHYQLKEQLAIGDKQDYIKSLGGKELSTSELETHRKSRADLEESIATQTEVIRGLVEEQAKVAEKSNAVNEQLLKELEYSRSRRGLESILGEQKASAAEQKAFDSSTLRQKSQTAEPLPASAVGGYAGPQLNAAESSRVALENARAQLEEMRAIIDAFGSLSDQNASAFREMLSAIEAQRAKVAVLENQIKNQRNGR